MADLIFLTGPTRSGKSRRAVEMAQSWGEGVVFVATYRSDAGDDEMVERVRFHRVERSASWRTLEAPADIVQALADLRPTPSGAVVDSMVLWLADRLDQDDASLVAAWERQLDGFRATPHPVIVVGDEIGWGPVPMDKMVAGCGVRLK
jgi:adenosylcobinamide kinase/adenosylcobinamide-phosphate guanylyltransferase